MTVSPKQAERDPTAPRRMDLEARAQLLRDTSLSADLLERARALLKLCGREDYVIHMDPPAS